MIKKLNQNFFIDDAVSLAQKLLGKILIRKIDGKMIKARIVETEAYMGATDRASHSYGAKKTLRTAPLYQIGGTTYVYLIYGMYYCFNIVCNVENNPQAVLIRAVAIIAGSDVARDYIAHNNRSKKIEQWTNGPGKLALALKIDQSLNQLHLLSNNLLTIVDDGFLVSASDIIARKRINIDYAKEDRDHLWRFYLDNNPFVSKMNK